MAEGNISYLFCTRCVFCSLQQRMVAMIERVNMAVDSPQWLPQAICLIPIKPEIQNHAQGRLPVHPEQFDLLNLSFLLFAFFIYFLSHLLIHPPTIFFSSFVFFISLWHHQQGALSNFTLFHKKNKQ